MRRVVASRRRGVSQRSCDHSGLLLRRQGMPMSLRRDERVAHPRLGAVAGRDGVVFTVWAPAQREVALAIDGKPDTPMTPEPGGYFSAAVPHVRDGCRYRFRLAQGLRPDPVSRFQPDGPFGPSMVVDPRAFQWHVGDWAGAVPRHRQVVYELHIGTFTRGGSWTTACERLPHLASIGVTTIGGVPI